MTVSNMTEKEDRPAFVRFERRTIENKAESLKQGRYVGTDVDYALITPPYSKDCVEHPVEKWMTQNEIYANNGRLPKEWLEHWKKAYQAWKNGQEMPLNGTSVKNWSAISPTQVKTLVSVGIHTIEDLAHCNDEGMRRIGMGAVEMRNKAIAWLTAAEDHGPLVTENAELKKKNAQLEAQVAELTDKVTILKAQVGNQSIVQPVESNEITADDLIDPVVPIRPQIFEKTKSYSEMERSELEVVYKERFGRKPRYDMTKDSILKKLGA